MWNALRVASYCGSNCAFANMPETLQKKKIRLYSHLIKAMEKPTEYPMLYQIILNNVCKGPKEIPDDQTQQKLLVLEQRLVMLEHKLYPAVHYWLGQLAWESRQRIAMLEQRQELLAQVLVKLTKRKS